MRVYYRHLLKSAIKVQKILTVDYFKWKPAYNYPTETHDFWEFCYIDKGNITYKMQDFSVLLKQDDCFFLPPGVPHWMESDRNTPADIVFLCFECRSPLMDTLARVKVHITGNDKLLLKNLLAEYDGTFYLSDSGKLVPIAKPNIGGEQCMQMYLELLIISILRKQTKEEGTPPLIIIENDIDKITNLVIKEINNMLYEKFSIEKICEAVHYSRSYISHAFKKEMGKSIVTYCNECKIAEAKKLLKKPGTSVTQVSEKLNFTNLHYFCSLFKKITGTTPSAYKSQIKDSNDSNNLLP